MSRVSHLPPPGPCRRRWERRGGPSPVAAGARPPGCSPALALGFVAGCHQHLTGRITLNTVRHPAGCEGRPNTPHDQGRHPPSAASPARPGEQQSKIPRNPLSCEQPAPHESSTGPHHPPAVFPCCSIPKTSSPGDCLCASSELETKGWLKLKEDGSFCSVLTSS